LSVISLVIVWQAGQAFLEQQAPDAEDLCRPPLSDQVVPIKSRQAI